MDTEMAEMDGQPLLAEGAPSRAEVPGGWVYRPTPKHVCSTPNIDNHVFAGSIWQCAECAQFWIVAERKLKSVGEPPFERGTGQSVKVFRKCSKERADRITSKARS